MTNTVGRVAGAGRRIARAGARRTRSALHRADARVSRRLGVLCYHRVGPTDVDPWDLAVSPANFADHLDVMAAAGTVVRLVDEVRSPRRDRVGTSDRRFAVTFDDGYVDNLTTALPLLERHDAPVTVFIPTGFLDTDAFWWDRVAALTLTPGRSVTATAQAARAVGLVHDRDLAEVESWTPAHLHAVLYDAVQFDDDVDGRLDALEAQLDDPPRPPQRPMTTEELVVFAEHPLVDIGGHTVRHPTLPVLDETSALAEIETGLVRLAEILGTRPRLFAYPHGEGTRRTASIVASSGVSHAFTTADRWVSPLDTPRRLPRLHPMDLERDDFARWLGVDLVSPVAAGGSGGGTAT